MVGACVVSVSCPSAQSRRAVRPIAPCPPWWAPTMVSLARKLRYDRRKNVHHRADDHDVRNVVLVAELLKFLDDLVLRTDQVGLARRRGGALRRLAVDLDVE